MKKMKDFLAKGEPFSVIQYFVSFKGIKENTNKKYELIHVNPNKNLSFKALNRSEIAFFTTQIPKFDLVVNSKSGRVFEFNNFRQHKARTVLNPQKNNRGDYPDANIYETEHI